MNILMPCCPKIPELLQRSYLNDSSALEANDTLKLPTHRTLTTSHPMHIRFYTIFVIFLFAGTVGNVQAQGLSPEERLDSLGIQLAPPPSPFANYVRAVQTGNLVFLAGHGPYLPDGTYITGKLGQDLTLLEGYVAARQTAILLLASLKQEIGDLSRVTRIVKVNGMVNATADFTDHPNVINGCSDLLVEVFGPEIGKHARAAVGMNSLPIGIAVEIDMVVEVAL